MIRSEVASAVTGNNNYRITFNLIGKVLLGLLLLCIVAAVAFVSFILPRGQSGGGDALSFSFDSTMNIEKKTLDGTPYTLNNSTATFKLDLSKPDVHSGMIFTNYTSALKYCQEHGLSTIPSVQLIQGKLKVFDDSLCATFELAMVDQRNRMLARLLEILKPAAPSEAVVHIAAALSLAGVEPEVDANLVQQVQVAREAFLETPDARPIGFWDGNASLRRSFQSDKFLMQGFTLHDSPEVCIAISQAIMGDATLKSEFKQIWEFGSKLTNPPSSIPFDQVANLTPEQARQNFPVDAKFAVIAYSASMEDTFLERCLREGTVAHDTNLMALIIDAVRGGKLSLEPRLDSGWYDYQWHALETLLVPERGMESVKLHLSEAYKKRLESAFASALTKQRETHIKRLPIATMRIDDEQDQSAPKVMVSPEFSAEPTLTVYLRLGRGYRFLRQAMLATLGEEKLSEIRRPSSDCSVEAELQEMAWFCYGLYEKLCLEIGRVPVYLPGELSAAERAAAIAVFDAWRENWLDDPVLALDTRVAVPIGEWDDRSVVYWGTAGVRLQAVSYNYLDKPDVSGNVEPTFVPAQHYLATDLFFEFKTPASQHLTRTEFRVLCDSCPDVTALHEALGVAPAAAFTTQGGAGGRWIQSNRGWAIFVLGIVLFWRVRRVRRWLVLAMIVMGTSWVCLFVLSPFYRTKFIVRHVATINLGTGVLCEERLIPKISAAPRMRALSELLSDSHPQIRYLAARFIVFSSEYFDVGENNSAWFQPGIKECLLQAANDPDPEIVSLIISSLSRYHDSDVIDFLLAKLESIKAHDELCMRVIRSLRSNSDSRTIKAIRPFCDDPRTRVSQSAIRALADFPYLEALEPLLQRSKSPVSLARNFTLNPPERNYYRWCGMDKSEDEAWSLTCDEIVLERMRQASWSFNSSWRYQDLVTYHEIVSESLASMLESATSSGQSNQVIVMKAFPYLQACISSLNDWELMQGVVTHAPEGVALAEAIRKKDAKSFEATLKSIFSKSVSDPDASVSVLSQKIMDE